MKWIIWTIGGLLAAVWTGALALVAGAVGWIGDAASGGATAVVGTAAVELPAWLAGWVDAAAWQQLVQTVRQATDAMQSVLPAVGSLSGWIEGFVWVVWGLGMLLLLILAGLSHGLLAARRAPSGAAA